MPDSQTLGLVVAAMIAGVICVRLYWVLGRRTGNEPQATPAAATPRVMAAAQPALPSNGMLDIQAADRDFDTAKFLDGARGAYTQIVTAFAQGDREALRPLLSPDVMAAFEAGIAGRSEAPAPLVRLTDARIVGASLEGGHAEITIAFTAEFSSGTTTDVWTFARQMDSTDPNWTLVATS
ncbi:MAG TPA: Tim44/TimA family putative adaptor protein, partial [Rhizomicrobium sp.]|nr:Tim44/TimA family putative adaptor protein [Rhizomicrobium sp.]